MVQSPVWLMDTVFVVVGGAVDAVVVCLFACLLDLGLFVVFYLSISVLFLSA